MARRTTGSGSGRSKQPALTDADIEQLLDRLDDALLSPDLERVQSESSEVIARLWTVRRGMPERLAQRLIAGRSRVPGFAFELLGGFAGGQTPAYLRRIAREPAAPAIVRFGAQRRAGWPERGEAKRRREFLDTLPDADGTLVLATDQGTTRWPPESEIVEEVLGYLTVLASERRRAIMERIAAAVGPAAVWLLQAVIHIDDPDTQRLALKELVRLRDPGTLGAIRRLAQTARTPELHTEAEAAAQRLRLQVVGADSGEEALAYPPFEWAMVSALDGDGGQAVLVVRRPAEGFFLLTNIFHNEIAGIKGAYGSTRIAEDEVADMPEEFAATGVAMVQVDLPVVRGILAAAVAVNTATGHGIPPAFELWEPFVHESYPPPPDEAVIVPELDDAPYARRNDLIRSSGRLSEHPWFAFWAFEPAYVGMALITTAPPQGRVKDEHLAPILEKLLTREMRDRLRSRLRRQAWLLDAAGDIKARDLALATAAQLAGADAVALTKNRFLIDMFRRATEDMYQAMIFGPPRRR